MSRRNLNDRLNRLEAHTPQPAGGSEARAGYASVGLDAGTPLARQTTRLTPLRHHA
jgi:hypothetical protein